MTWEPAKRRWRKMYKGKTYLVPCEELNAPLYTTEASYRLANEWWKRKEAELRRPDTRTELVTLYQRADLEERIEKGREAEVLLRAMQALSLIDAAPVGQAHLPTERLLEAASQVEGRPVTKDRTVGHQLERYLALELARGKAPNTYADIDFLLKKALLCPAFKPERPIDQITAQTVSDLYPWLKNESKLASTAKRGCLPTSADSFGFSGANT